jgi:5'-3' exonuclease
MGIPSYYKKLADSLVGLITKSIPSKPSSLYFDFNCMIYHCARRPNTKLPPYPGLEGQKEWEDALLDDIVRYVVKVWHEVGTPKTVFLAVDGVVPMAKIKQQRMRRFKSVWLAEEEKKAGLRTNAPSWDTNCITPGTQFMKRLTNRLQDLCAKRSHWSVSGADEPGEGEHKIMNKLRSAQPSTDPIIVYGLDADLILLTLLNAKSPAYLVREDSELGVVQTNSLGEETYSFFSLDVLKKTIPCETVDYVAAMSLLGNDFLPHSLTVKMKGDGHTLLCECLKALAHQKLELVNKETMTINYDMVAHIVEQWSFLEEAKLLQTFKKKLQMRGSVEQTLENLPVLWAVESALARKSDAGWMLDSTWRSVYETEWLGCKTPQEIDLMCAEYFFGLQWVLDYYVGKSVPMTWCYPKLLPPLWSHLHTAVKRGVQIKKKDILSKPILPSEQLAMVLPLESWHLLEEGSLRSLPSRLPQFWPQRFGLFSVGRMRLWECEPLLPSLTIDRVRGNL